MGNLETSTIDTHVSETTALEKENGETKHTKNIVTTVKAMMDLPCLTLSIDLCRAALASTMEACCCFRVSRPWI